MVLATEPGRYSVCVLVRYSQCPVPLLDATVSRLALPDDIRKAPHRLPTFKGPIPRGSLALVAYTVGSYRKGDVVNVALNIVWAAVLYSPNVEVLPPRGM